MKYEKNEQDFCKRMTNDDDENEKTTTNHMGIKYAITTKKKKCKTILFNDVNR